jgi:hypothetical protein
MMSIHLLQPAEDWLEEPDAIVMASISGLAVCAAILAAALGFL